MTAVKRCVRLLQVRCAEKKEGGSGGSAVDIKKSIATSFGADKPRMAVQQSTIGTTGCEIQFPKELYLRRRVNQETLSGRIEAVPLTK